MVMRLGDKKKKKTHVWICESSSCVVPGDREPLYSAQHFQSFQTLPSFSFSSSFLHLLHLLLSPSFLPSVHLNCRCARSRWWNKIEHAHQRLLPSSRVSLFDQLIRGWNQAWRWEEGRVNASKNISLPALTGLSGAPFLHFCVQSVQVHK